jgi:hypothetical protein
VTEKIVPLIRWVVVTEKQTAQKKYIEKQTQESRSQQQSKGWKTNYTK